MFAWWGRTVYRYRFIVIGVMVALCLGGGVFGLSLGKHVTQSGFYDDGSQSVQASVLGDQVYGRDRSGHIVAIFQAPAGKTVDDPAWSKKVVDELNRFQQDHPDQVLGWAGYLRASQATGMATADKKYTFVSIPLKGDDDDTILNNYKAIAPDLQRLDGGTVKLAGLQPVAEALTGTIATDQRRMEVLALPLVAVVLFFVFGGVIAAGLPVMVGGLCIAGALGIMRFLAIFGPVHYFAQPVVSLIGLGIAIDYGLFIVSRFREEIAEGYDTETAVRRTVITAGRTVTFSAVLIVASAIGLLLFPQGFLKSLTYATIASVMLSAILSITVLPACLGILGKHVDALGVRTLFRVPFLANWKISAAYLNWLADRLQRTKTREEVEAGFWGKLVNRVMKRPVLFAAPIVIIMILLIIPVGKLSLGGISEKYLPPTNSVRQAQEEFDKLFPGYRTNPLTLVIQTSNHQPVTDAQIADIRSKAMAIGGFIEPDNDPANMWQERAYAVGASKDPSVRVLQNGLINPADASKKLTELRAITAQRNHGLGRWNSRPGAGFNPRPVREDAADGGHPADHHDRLDVLGVRLGGAANQGDADERSDARVHHGHPDVDIRRRTLFEVAEFHADPADSAGDRADHRAGLRPIHRLRGVLGVPDGRGARARHVDPGGDPDRHRSHRTHHYRRGADCCRRRGRVRVLRPGDDEVSGLWTDGGAAAGRDRGADVFSAIGDEAARR